MIAVCHGLPLRKSPRIGRWVKDFGLELSRIDIFADDRAIAHKDRPIRQNDGIDVHSGDVQRLHLCVAWETILQIDDKHGSSGVAAVQEPVSTAADHDSLVLGRWEQDAGGVVPLVGRIIRVKVVWVHIQPGHIRFLDWLREGIGQRQDARLDRGVFIKRSARVEYRAVLQKKHLGIGRKFACWMGKRGPSQTGKDFRIEIYIVALVIDAARAKYPPAAERHECGVPAAAVH